MHCKAGCPVEFKKKKHLLLSELNRNNVVMVKELTEQMKSTVQHLLVNNLKTCLNLGNRFLII